MKEFVYLKPELKKGNLVAIDLATGKESSHVVRDHMLQLAKENDQYIKVDIDTGRAFRTSALPKNIEPQKEEAKVETPADPVVAFIKNAPKLKPNNFIINIFI